MNFYRFSRFFLLIFLFFSVACSKKAPTLTFTKLVTSEQNVTSEELLKQILERRKRGYTIKSITLNDPSSVRIEGIAPNFSLKFKRAGTFTITTVLEKKGFEDAILSGTIEYLPKPKFTFLKLITDKKTISNNEILKQIEGARHKGYRVKNIILKDPSFASVVTGQGGKISLKLKKTGAFTGKVILEKEGHPDISLISIIEHESIFIFDKDTKNITGVKEKYKEHTKTLENLTFPDKIEGIEVEYIKHIEEFKYNSDNEYYNFFGDSSKNVNKHIKTIYLPKNLRTIGDLLFYGCTNLTSIILPNSITSIGKSAFSSCSNLTSVILPNSVTSIGQKAFYKCPGLTSITIPNSVETIGNSAFFGCTSLTSIIPDSVTTIEGEVFFGCSSLSSITLPNSVETIEDWAFYNCSNLTSIVLPDSVKTIKGWAFESCNNLTSIILSSSVKTVGGYAFSNCKNLTVTIEQTDPTKIILKNYEKRGYPFDDVKQINVPQASLATYKKADIWKKWANKIVGY